MADNNITLDVTNKSAGMVMYRTSYGQRLFEPHQTWHNISINELKELVSSRGGAVLFYNYLYIENPEMIKALLDKEAEPEYWITEDQIPAWMNNCSLDEFKDALDFAPQGTIDIIKNLAVTLPLNDYSKRQAIKDQLGLDVTAAIENMKPENDEVKEEVRAENGRRASTNTSDGRRQPKITIPSKT